MKITLEKNGEQITYNTGLALYLLLSFIPIVGSITFLVLSIIRKQFRGIVLNQLLITIIANVILSIVYISKIEFLLHIVAFGVSILFMVILAFYVLNANTYSVKARLAEGYTVVGDSQQHTEILTKAANIKMPFWQILRF